MKNNFTKSTFFFKWHKASLCYVV